MALDNLGKDDIPGRLRQMEGKAKGGLIMVKASGSCAAERNIVSKVHEDN
jgi:hypothetical protein